MTEPTRLLHGDASEFERLLLGAAACERPSHLQRQRMRRVIALTQLGFFASTAKAIAGFAPHVVVVAVVATTLAGSASSPTVEATREAPAAAAVPNVPAAPAKTEAHRDSYSDRVDASREAHSNAAVESQKTSHEEASAQKPELRPKAVASARGLPDLREEIVLMDQARTALRQGAPMRSLTALEQYRVRFPRGSFGQEALVLRVEALLASGNRSKAVAEAHGFLSRDPHSPHAERLRSVIGTPSERR